MDLLWLHQIWMLEEVFSYSNTVGALWLINLSFQLNWHFCCVLKLFLHACVWNQSCQLYCTSYQKLACFMLYLKIINKFLKNKVCILHKIVQGTPKWHWNFSRPSLPTQSTSSQNLQYNSIKNFLGYGILILMLFLSFLDHRRGEQFSKWGAKFFRAKNGAPAVARGLAGCVRCRIWLFF